ncbi:hypothetical protein chiPu_0032469, partial [Chiloscyllium punctatum]|nr:hypothetical protein [Chiloscyllium punctatum]
MLLRVLEVVIVGGNHHHLLRRQAQQLRGAEIGFRIGLVMLEQLGRHHEVPGKACELRHVGQQRDIAVGERRDDILGLQPGQAGDAVRPPVQAMPAQRQMIQVGFGQPVDAELRDQLLQRAAVQDVEDDVAVLRVLAHLIHRGRIDRTPAVDQRGPVGLD